jgi:GDP/UDP-N,N'-diacetylbacillosamine 2-epimerase (hydrolysing)
MASSVINCDPTKESICRALLELNSYVFQETLKNVENPYGRGGSAEEIYKVIKAINPDNLRFKTFINIL